MRSGIETERGGVASVAAPLGVDCVARGPRGWLRRLADASQLFRWLRNCVKRPLPGPMPATGVDARTGFAASPFGPKVGMIGP